MKKFNLLIYFIPLILFLSGKLEAQNITLLGSTSVSAKGNGAAGVPSLNWDIPAGQNRVMIVHFIFERDHSPIPPNSDNYPSGNYGADYFPLTVGGVAMTGRTVLRSYYKLSATPGSPSVDNSDFGTVFYRYTLSDADGLPTGNATFDFSGINLPENAADEVAVSIEIYGNVSPTTTYTPMSANAIDNNSTVTSISVNPTVATAPAGRTAADVMYVAFGATSKDETLAINAGWTIINNMRVNNDVTGLPIIVTGVAPVNEGDGISLLTAYRSGTPGNTTLTKSSNQRIAMMRLNIVPLLPLAKPSVAGTVYNDPDGLPNINGTGTNGGGLWVYAIDENGKVAGKSSAVVNGSGSFTIPTGKLVENETYRIILTNVNVAEGADEPVKTLNTGWITIGENTTGVTPFPDDGTPDGEMTITAGAANISGVRFGIYQLARPLASGTVYNDITGLPDIDGTGTNAGGLYVNAVDTGGVVRGVATVAAATGNWSIAANNLYESYTYDFQLSKNQGTVGQPAPAMELPAGWATVGENDATTGNDGSPDGSFTWTMGSTAKTGIYFGITNADMEVTKTVNMVTANHNQNVVFTITAKNNGTAANTGVIVNDLLPSGYIYVSHTASTGTYTSGTGVWNIGNMAGGATATLTITANAQETGDHINIADISGDNHDIDTSNNTSSASVSVGVACVKPGATGDALASMVGVLTKEEPTVTDWPASVPNGYLVLDAASKGMVITHMTTAQIESLEAIEGMLVYDTDKKCVKLYRGTNPGVETGQTGWVCIQRICLPD